MERTSRNPGPARSPANTLARPPTLLVIAFLVVTLVLFVSANVLYQNQIRFQRNDARAALTAVSVLKADQISRWREGRLSDATLWSKNPYLAEPVLRYLAAPTPAAQAVLRASLRAWKKDKAWADLAVTGAAGNLVFSLSGETGTLPQAEAAALHQAFDLHRPVLTDLHREAAVPPHLSAVAPLFTISKGGKIPAGAVVLRCAASSVLYPLIFAWPTASRTAETALWRRDGNDMMVLNELRHRSHAAFELRVSLTQRNVPVVMAASGVTGFVEGVDYRGVPVFADLRAIPGTPWFAVTKIDIQEALAPMHAGAAQLAFLVAGLLTAVSALFFALWQIRSKAQYRLLLEAETERSATAARLAAIVDGSHDCIAATTNDGVVTAWNQAAEHLFGYSAAEMIGQDLHQLMLPIATSSDEAILAVVRGGGWFQPYETLRITKAGQLLDVSISVSPIKDASGTIVGSSRICRDITEQKRIRRDLDGLRWMLSPPAGEAAPALPDQALDCPFAAPNTSRLIHDAAGESLLAELAGGFHVLMGTCFAVHEANGDLAYSVLSSDWRRFLDTSSTRYCKSAGVCRPQECARWECYGSPAKNAALESMERDAPVDVECLDKLRLFAVPIHAGGDVVGCMSMGYGDPPCDPFLLEQLAARFGVEAAELNHHASDYETRPPFIVELAKQRLAGSARLLGEIVQRSRADALLRQTTAELARSNLELEQFAYVASHDLQEPLRMVASYTQLLAQRYGDKLDQDARDFIDYAVDGATRMKQLIEDLLTYSRATTRARPAAVVDTADSLALALRNLDAAIRETGARVDSGELPPVLADAGQMVQLFQNLVGNAVKFRTPGLPPLVRIEACRAPLHPRQWLFRVADNGIGIDAKYFERVFAIFQRLHTRQEYPGTGIGLALCQRIVERHDGRIWVESEPGKGTAFLFTLPEAVPEPELP